MNARVPASDSIAHLRAVAESLPGFVWSARSDGVWDFCNSAFLSYLGRAAGDAIGRAWLDIVHLDDRPGALAAWERALGTGDPYATDLRVRRGADGEYRWFTARALPQRDASGAVIRWFGTMTDIQSRIDAERTMQERDALAGELRRQSELVRAVVDTSPTAIFVKDLAGRYLMANPQALAELERTIDEVVGKTDYDLLPREVAEELRAYDRLALDRDDRVAREETLVTSAGSRTLLAVKLPLKDAAGVPYAVCGIAIDITDRKRVEAALRENEARLRLALRAGRLGIWEWDVATGSIFWSDECFELTGVARAAFSGGLEDVRGLIHPDDRERVWRASEQALAARADYVEDFRIVLPDGGTRWLSNCGMVLTDQAGQPTKILGIVQDVSDRVTQYQTVRGAASLMRTIADTAPVFIAYCTPDARYAFVNRPFAARFDRIPQECLGRHISEVVGDAMFEQMRGYVADAAAGRPVEFELDMSSPAMGRRFMHCRFAPHVDSEGRLRGFVAVMSDLTARRELEEALKSADREKDQFIAVLSHELRNHLAPMDTASTLLDTSDLPPVARDRARAVLRRQIDHLRRLVEDLLDFSRLGHGTLALDLAPADIRQTITHAIDVVQPRFTAKHQIVHVSLPDQPMIAVVDAMRLTQVFANLLMNASKFAPDGSVIAVSGENAADELHVSIADEGEGIAPDLIPHIFDAFVQGTHPGGPAREGLGLGLNIVKHLVTMHGGRISAASEGSGRGARFTVTLPSSAGAR